MISVHELEAQTLARSQDFREGNMFVISVVGQENKHYLLPV